MDVAYHNPGDLKHRSDAVVYKRHRAHRRRSRVEIALVAAVPST